MDLALVLQSAQNYTQQKMQREDRKLKQDEYQHGLEVERKKQEMALKIKQAQAKFLQAQDPNAKQQAMVDLQAVDPNVALATQEKMTDLDEQQVDIEGKQRKSASDLELRTAQAMKQSLEAYATNPSQATLNREVMRLGSLSRNKVIKTDPQALLQFKASPPSPGSPRFQEMMRGFDDTIGMLGEKPESEFYGGNQFKEISTNLASRLAGEGRPDPRVLRDPDYAQMQYPEIFSEETAKWNADRAAGAKAKGLTVVNRMPSTSEPTRQVETNLQNQAVMLDGVVDLIDTIQKDITPESFTYLGRGGAYVSDKLQQAGVPITPEMSQRIDEQQTLASDATFMTYQLIVAWSGKAVTDRERKMLFEAIGDPKAMGYTRYQAALKGLRKMANTTSIGKRKVLRFGVDTTLNESERRMIDSKISAIEQRRLGGEIDDEQAIKEMQKVGVMFETRARLASRRSKSSGPAPSRDRLEKLRALRDSGASEEEIEEAMRGL